MITNFENLRNRLVGVPAIIVRIAVKLLYQFAASKLRVGLLVNFGGDVLE